MVHRSRRNRVTLHCGASVARMEEVCQRNPDSEECEQTAFKQTGRAAGSIGGGMAGGAIASYGACTLVLAPTTGPGALACGIIAGGAGGIVGSQGGSWIFKKGGSFLYETIAKPIN